MFDTWEGRNRYGLPIADKLDPYYLQVIEGFKKIASLSSNSQDEKIRHSIEEFIQRIRLVPQTTFIQPIDDADVVLRPAGCDLVQIAHYTAQGELFVGREAWEKFNNTDKAALILHEMIYLQMRMSGEKTSTRARLAVANALAGRDFGRVDAEVPSGSLVCETDWSASGTYDPSKLTRFWAFNDKSGTLVLQFSILSGQSALGTTRVKLSKKPARSLVSGSCWREIGSLEAVTYPNSRIELEAQCMNQRSKIVNTISHMSPLSSVEPVVFTCH